jgi:triacylglycerol lipase
MVGWHLLLLLVIEVTLYGAASRHMHVAYVWSVPCAVGLAVAVYVSVRVVLVGAEFMLTRWKGAPIPDALRVPPLSLMTMYLRELGGWLLMFTFVLPFILARRSVLDRPSGPLSDKLPLLLVHGLACNRGNWFWFRRQLERRGHCVYTVDCTPPFTQIANYAPQIARAVDEILEATGAKRLVLIGHSQGGLVSRAYLDQFGADKVVHVITLGTPHLGTWMANFAVGPNVRNMAVDGPWLAGLHEREGARSTQPYANFTCVYTCHDNLVTPQTNAALPGAEQIALSGIGHLSLALSSGVVKHVLGVLERVGKSH